MKHCVVKWDVNGTRSEVRHRDQRRVEKNICGLFCIKAEHVVQQEARWALHLSDCFTFPTTKPTTASKNQQVTVSSRRHQSSEVLVEARVWLKLHLHRFIHLHQNKNIKTLSVWIQPETRTKQMKNSDLKEPNCWFQTVNSWTSRPFFSF